MKRIDLFVLPLFLFLMLFSCYAHARTWHILADGSGDASTIQAGIDSAATGDTVLVACGTYYEHDLIMKSQISLIGEPSTLPCVTIDAQHEGSLMLCNTISSALIEHIEFTGASLQAMIINGWITVRNCVFANNDREAISISYTEPEFYNCIFFGNGFSPPSYTVFCVYAGANPLFKNCTFVDNYAGINAAMDSFPYIENCIIAHCQTISLSHGEMSWYSVSCSNLYANGDAEADSAILSYFSSCFIADPQFCGISDSHNYYLQSDSPCAPGNHPDTFDCDLIGALPVNCGSVDVKKETLGSIKALFE